MVRRSGSEDGRPNYPSWCRFRKPTNAATATAAPTMTARIFLYILTSSVSRGFDHQMRCPQTCQFHEWSEGYGVARRTTGSP